MLRREQNVKNQNADEKKPNPLPYTNNIEGACSYPFHRWTADWLCLARDHKTSLPSIVSTGVIIVKQIPIIAW